MTTAALFDLDRTLVSVNTASLWLRSRLQSGEAKKREVLQGSWWLLRYFLGAIDAEEIARRAALPYAGLDEVQLAAKMKSFVIDTVLAHVSQAARDEVQKRQRDGFVCAIVTGSTAYSAEPLGDALGIDHVLCSRMVVVDGRLTGKLHAPLCYGNGKVALAEAWAESRGVDLSRSVFYSDSISDLPLFERVGERFCVNPDPRLAWTARRRGWQVLRWR